MKPKTKKYVQYVLAAVIFANLLNTLELVSFDSLPLGESSNKNEKKAAEVFQPADLKRVGYAIQSIDSPFASLNGVGNPTVASSGSGQVTRGGGAEPLELKKLNLTPGGLSPAMGAMGAVSGNYAKIKGIAKNHYGDYVATLEIGGKQVTGEVGEAIGDGIKIRSIGSSHVTIDSNGTSMTLRAD